MDTKPVPDPLIEKLRLQVKATLKEQHGVLLGEKTLVHRVMYVGRDIIAKNSSLAPEDGMVDDRGYVPVERWVMSLTKAANSIPKENEGLTKVSILEHGSVPLAELAKDKVISSDLFGPEMAPFESWPLTKILDIGYPGIPCHIHSGDVSDGGSVDISSGKLEAYFFPPIVEEKKRAEVFEDPKHGGPTTRIGLKDGIERSDVVAAVKKYGIDDSAFGLLKSFRVSPYDCWHIPPGTCHAPGPYPTFEIQRPQDDFNLLAPMEGRRIEDSAERQKEVSELCLRGLKSAEELVDRMVDFHSDVSTCSAKDKVVFRSGPDDVVVVRQIFFKDFYGESIEINSAGKSRVREEDKEAFAGIVWSGSGLCNGNKLQKDDEFFVAAGTASVRFECSVAPFVVFTFFPIRGR